MCRKECVDLQVNVLYCGTCDNSCDNNTEVNTGLQGRGLPRATCGEDPCKAADTVLLVSLPGEPCALSWCLLC